MKRNQNGPNTFSQTIKDLQPGRLYSMKMFSCDYEDLTNPKAKKLEEANKFIGSVTLEGVEVDSKRSFTEMYSSNPNRKYRFGSPIIGKFFGPKARLQS
jgi:hypothetical protein